MKTAMLKLTCDGNLFYIQVCNVSVIKATDTTSRVSVTQIGVSEANTTIAITKNIETELAHKVAKEIVNKILSNSEDVISLEALLNSCRTSLFSNTLPVNLCK